VRNSILLIIFLAIAAACQKNETTLVAISKEGDKTVIPLDTSIVENDSTNLYNAPAKIELMTEQDKKFADGAAKVGLMQVMMGEIAIKNAYNPLVKSLGQMIIKDHGLANGELKNWAATIGYTLPTKLNADQQNIYNKLKSRKGVDFDRFYTSLLVTFHQKDIASFTAEVNTGSENALKSFASKTIPTLEYHLMKAEEAQDLVK
jgi:putative membrane protein